MIHHIPRYMSQIIQLHVSRACLFLSIDYKQHILTDCKCLSTDNTLATLYLLDKSQNLPS